MEIAQTLASLWVCVCVCVCARVLAQVGEQNLCSTSPLRHRSFFVSTSSTSAIITAGVGSVQARVGMPSLGIPRLARSFLRSRIDVAPESCTPVCFTAEISRRFQLDRVRFPEVAHFICAIPFDRMFGMLPARRDRRSRYKRGEIRSVRRADFVFPCFDPQRVLARRFFTEQIFQPKFFLSLNTCQTFR